MPRENSNTVTMEGVQLVFRNFRGDPGKFNPEGHRNFGVVLPNSEVAQAMLADGWNVKQFNPRDEDEEGVEPEYWLPVKVRYDGFRPPKVTVLTDPEDPRKRKNIGEDEVENLDWAEIINVDLIVRPSHYDVQGRQGIAAYLQTMFVTIEQDELEQKYAMDTEEPDQQ